MNVVSWRMGLRRLPLHNLAAIVTLLHTEGGIGSLECK